MAGTGPLPETPEPATIFWFRHDWDMMQTKALDTMGRDGTDQPDAPVAPRTLRSAVQASSPLALGIAASAVAVAICSSLSSLVPLAAALPVAMLVAPALVDVLDRRLPNRMVAVAALIGIAAATVSTVLGGQIDVQGAALGAAAFSGPLLLMHLVAPMSMGLGDVKVAVVLGGAVGMVDPFFALLALAAGSFLGAVIGIIGRRRTIAFGPALVGGAIIALVLAASPVEVFDGATESLIANQRPSEVVRS